MIKPQLNINGSSKDDLLMPRLNAMDLIMEAIEALKQATPNGRDYPGNAVACTADRETHYYRLKAMRKLYDEIMAEAVYIRDQNNPQEA